MKVEIRDAILLLESEITQLVFNKIKEDPESGRKIDVAWKNIKNLLESEDVLDCINSLKESLGVKIIKKKNIYQVYGNGLNSFKIKKQRIPNIEKLKKVNPGTQFRGKLLNFQKEGLDFLV